MAYAIRFKGNPIGIVNAAFQVETQVNMHRIAHNEVDESYTVYVREYDKEILYPDFKDTMQALPFNMIEEERVKYLVGEKDPYED